MENLTLAQIKDFAIVFLAVLAFIVLVGNVVKTINEWRKPGMSEAEWRREVDRKLGSDNERIKSLEDGNKVVCRHLPVRPGRNRAIIVEAAAVNHRQKKMGYNAAQELYKRVQANLMGGNRNDEDE